LRLKSPFTEVWSTVFLNCCTTPAFTDATTNLAFATQFVDPQFVDAPSGNWRLRGTSPCINTGANATWMMGARDLDDQQRLDRFSGQVDIGAYEHIASGSAVIIR